MEGLMLIVIRNDRAHQAVISRVSKGKSASGLRVNPVLHRVLEDVSGKVYNGLAGITSIQRFGGLTVVPGILMEMEEIASGKHDRRQA